MENGIQKRMKLHSNIYKTFDIVVVPFPFVDGPGQKMRPAIILSSKENFNDLSEHLILGMITSSFSTRWPLDIEIADLESAGLEKRCLIRFKLFTIDIQLIRKKIGYLSQKDKIEIKKALKLIFYNE